MPDNKEAGINTGNDGATSAIRDESTVTEFYGHMVRADSLFEVKKDGDHGTLSIDKDVVADAGDVHFEVNSRVAFKTSPDGSKVLSLRKYDENEGATGDEEATKEADKTTKSA